MYIPYMARKSKWHVRYDTGFFNYTLRTHDNNKQSKHSHNFKS